MSLHLHLFNDLLRTFNGEDLLNNRVKLLLRVLSKDRMMKEHLKFSLRLIFKVFSVGVRGSDKKEPPEESENNDTTMKKS